jgi:phosphatidylinositol glycan class V
MRHIALYGYTHEQTHAFFPFFPRCVLAPLSTLFHADPVLVGVLVNNFLFFPLAAFYLYRLSLVLSDSDHWARRAALAFCLTPASVFFSAPYTECCFALCSFVGMYALITQSKLTAFAAFLVAAAVRSNGVLYGGFFLWPHVYELLRYRRVVWRQLPFDLLAVAGLFAPTIAMEWYGRSLYCVANASSVRPYCDAPLWRPALYSFVQSHYWNQGFLRYWTLQQVPNFLLAAPTVLLCIVGCVRMAQHPDERLRWRVMPFVLLLGLMVAFGVLGSHVQTLTRFVSANPAVYWSLAGENRAALLYSVVYVVLGTVLFSTFYPWT